MKVNVKIENLKGEILSFDEGTTLEEVLRNVKDRLPYPCYLTKLDNAYRSLTHAITHDSTVEFLDMRNEEAWRVYQNSLVLIFIKAVHDLFGKKVLITVKNSLNKGLYITTTQKLNEEDIAAIKKRMNRIVEDDMPIIKEHFTKDGALILARKLKLEEAAKLLDSVTNLDDVQIYSLDDEIQIFYDCMAPSTGYIRLFEINLYRNGLILGFPHPAHPEQLEETETGRSRKTAGQRHESG